MFDETIASIRQKLRFWARRRTPVCMNGRFDTSDILQEASLQVWLELKQDEADQQQHSDTLLRTIARGHAAKLARHQDAECRSVHRESPGAEFAHAADVPAEVDAILSEDYSRLLLAMSKLPELDREILQSHVVDGSSLNDVADAMDIAPHTLRRRYHTIVEKLQREVDQQDE